MSKPEDMITEVVRLHTEGEEQKALDVLFHWVYNDLKKGGGYCDAMLRNVDLALLHEDIIVGILTITFSGRHLLPYRDRFMCQAQEVLCSRIGEEDTIESLQGLWGDVDPTRVQRIADVLSEIRLKGDKL